MSSNGLVFSPYGKLVSKSSVVYQPAAEATILSILAKGLKNKNRCAN